MNHTLIVSSIHSDKGSSIRFKNLEPCTLVKHFLKNLRSATGQTALFYAPSAPLKRLLKSSENVKYPEMSPVRCPEQGTVISLKNQPRAIFGIRSAALPGNPPPSKPPHGKARKLESYYCERNAFNYH